MFSAIHARGVVGKDHFGYFQHDVIWGRIPAVAVRVIVRVCTAFITSHIVILSVLVSSVNGKGKHHW